MNLFIGIWAGIVLTVMFALIINEMRFDDWGKKVSFPNFVIQLLIFLFFISPFVALILFKGGHTCSSTP